MIQTGSTTDTPNLSPTEGINNSSQQSDYLFKNSLEEHAFGSLPIKIDQIFSSIPKETIDDPTKLKQFYAVEAKLSSESPKLAEQWRKENENYSPEKGWSCNLCGKTLSCKQSLQKHLKIHTGVKPHKVWYLDRLSRVFLTINIDVYFGLIKKKSRVVSKITEKVLQIFISTLYILCTKLGNQGMR